jgi:5-methylcytosine-specific restriction endonuclease McrA
MDNPLQQSVLVLNSGMIPIEICSARKAVLDIFRRIAIAVQESALVLRSPSVTIRVPLIIARVTYHKIPKRAAALNKWSIMQRDDHVCAYCKKRAPLSELTVDHITPRSRWRREMGANPPYEFNSWQNLVTACRRCNSQKGNRLLGELGWRLDPWPAQPTYLPQLVISRSRAERMGWLEYCSYNVKLVESALD